MTSDKAVGSESADKHRTNLTAGHEEGVVEEGNDKSNEPQETKNITQSEEGFAGGERSWH